MVDWSAWLEDNYKYVLMGLCDNVKDRANVMHLAEICKKHNVSLKVVMDIINEFNEVTKND